MSTKPESIAKETVRLGIYYGGVIVAAFHHEWSSAFILILINFCYHEIKDRL